MDSEEIQQLSKEIEPNLSAILADFNAVLEKHGISGAKLVEFKIDEAQGNEGGESSLGGYCCWPCSGYMCCGWCPTC